MIFYKTLALNCFKPEVVFDTQEYNYGLVSGLRSKDEARLFDEIIRYSHLFGFETLIVMALRGGSPSSITPRDREIMGPTRAREFLELCRRVNLPQQNASTKFWEFLYEKVRKEYAPHRPSRTKSIFACRDLASVKRYKTLHQLGHTLCRVELLEGSFFEADMILTDRVDPDWSYTKSLPHIRNYWDGKVSEDPLHEAVIQGRFRMLPLD